MKEILHTVLSVILALLMCALILFMIFGYDVIKCVDNNGKYDAIRGACFYEVKR